MESWSKIMRLIINYANKAFAYLLYALYILFMILALTGDVFSSETDITVDFILKLKSVLYYYELLIYLFLTCQKLLQSRAHI